MRRSIPKYYSQFRRRVLAGEIPISREIASEMVRIDDLCDDPDIIYDSRMLDGFIAFVENEMTLTDGGPVVMLDSFKLWAESLLAWYEFGVHKVYVNDDNGGHFVPVRYLKRVVNKQYIIVARGAGKSMYAAYIQAYFLIVYGKTTHQITTAPTMKQAEEVMSPIRTAILRSPGPLFTFLTVKTKTAYSLNHGGGAQELLLSTKKGVESRITGSLLEIRPMSIDKLQGLRSQINTIDEWLSGDITEDVMGALEQGAVKNEDYVIIAISSEGTIRNGAGDTVKMELAKILRGEYDDRHTSIFHYKMDEIAEIEDPSLWLKANPNLGITVSYETYQRDVDRATNVPSTRNDILAKRFGIPTEGYTYFFTYGETRPRDYPLNFDEMECALGADMSQGDDFCSFTFYFPLRDGSFGVKSLNFITSRTYSMLTPAPRMKYEEFLAESTLIILEGTILDMLEVYEEVEEFIDVHNYDVLAFGYDPYNSALFVKRYIEVFGEVGVSVVRQGTRTESVPLGEIKHLTEDRGLLFDELIFSYAMGNTMVLEDTNGNRKIYKRRYDTKIDPVAALLDAHVAYSRNRDLFE